VFFGLLRSGGVDFRLLGPLEVFRDDGREVAVKSGRQRALLAVLLLRANELVSSDALVEELWGESPPPTAHKMLHNQVSALRRALGANGRLETRGSGYRLKLAEGERDVDRFETLVARGRERLDLDPQQAAAAFRQALELWRGPALADLAYEAFASREVARLEDARAVAFEHLIEAELALGHHAEVVGQLEALIEEHPYRERLRAQLMLALYRCDRQADALHAYQEARKQLVEELGIEPGERLRELERAILAQDPGLAAPATDAVDLPPELDTGTPLAGREAELDWLHEHWRAAHGGNGRLVLVAGEPGMGKTRLAAELAAELQRDRARVHYVSGVGAPEAGCAVLASAGGARRPTVLVLDDIDRADDALRTALGKLVDGLGERPVLVLATAEDPAFARVLHADGTLNLAPLDRNGMRAVVQLYAGAHDDVEVPVDQLAAASGGIPRRVHRAACEWARYEAARRLGASAGRAASERTSLRAAEDDLAGDVVELEAVRERAELLGGEGQVVACPFKGLASFDIEDAEVFFGRERLVADLVARLAGAPLMGILGPSGSGKSSALRAGLLAALTAGVLPGSERWALALLRPGEHPLRALHRATGDAASDHRQVVAVDQFEEAFTACRDESERAAFVDALLTAARDPRRRALVLIAVRADFYGRCSVYPELSRLLGANHVLVGPMRREELRRAIELPARRAGLRVEPELVHELIADVQDQPGALPLLSTALLELWQHRDGRRMRLSAYKYLGGVDGAVARLAESAYARLDQERAEAARRILLRLAGGGDGEAIVRRRVALTELGAEHDQRVADALAVLADDRLVTIGEGEAEVAHEALLREWPRLRDWLEEDAHGRRLHRHLTHAAGDWIDGGRDPSDLYPGTRLAAALEWRAEHEPELNPIEREFLDASDARRRGERAARKRRIRLAFAGLTAALVAITVVAIVAVNQGREAEHQRDIAVSRGIAASAANALTTDPSLSLSLAMRALDVANTDEAATVLRQATLDVRTLAVLPAYKGWAYSAVFSPDGRRAVSAGADGRVRLWDLEDRRPLMTLRDDRFQVFDAVFSPDGSLVATAAEDGTVRVIDVAHRKSRAVFHVSRQSASSVAFSPDGQRLAVAISDGTVRIARATLDGWEQVLRGHKGWVLGAEFSPDGRRILSWGEDRTLRVWDAVQGTPVHVLRGHRAGVTSAAFAPSGRTIVSTGYDATIRIWNATTGAEMSRTAASYGPLVVSFSPDGRQIVSAGDDGAVRVLDSSDEGAPALAVLRRHGAAVLDARFSPKGRRIISASQDGTLRLWDPGAPVVFRASVNDSQFTPDGSRIVGAGEDGTVRIWSAAGGPVQRTLSDSGRPASALAVSPDGQQVASGYRNGTLRIWQLQDVSRPLRLDGHNARISGLAYSADGRRLLSAGDDGRVNLWTPPRRQPVLLWKPRLSVYDIAFAPGGRRFVAAGERGALTIRTARADGRGIVLGGHRGAVFAAAFSPDGRTVVSGGADGTVRLWTSAGRALGVKRGHEGPVESVAFRPDGRRIVSAGTDGTVRVWDPAVREALVVLRNHRGSALAASFDPDGQRIVSAGTDGVVRVSLCEVCGSLAEVLALARARAARQLTREERERFLPSER
jgi:WD40 repeat protein/DNA-binding SARP family transcriptional activator